MDTYTKTKARDLEQTLEDKEREYQELKNKYIASLTELKIYKKSESCYK